MHFRNPLAFLALAIITLLSVMTTFVQARPGSSSPNLDIVKPDEGQAYRSGDLIRVVVENHGSIPENVQVTFYLQQAIPRPPSSDNVGTFSVHDLISGVDIQVSASKNATYRLRANWDENGKTAYTDSWGFRITP